MYSNINLTALEGALKDAINKEIKKVDYDASIDKYGNSYVADILASVLGVEVERKEFCWQAQVLCDCLTSTLNIGLTQIEITKGKNISTVIGEILAAVSDEYHGKCYEKSYCTFNDEGIGILYTPDENILDKMSIKELIAYLNEDRYCDDKFVEVMRSYGYEIKTGEHPDIGEALYIDISKYIKDAKVWLQEANRQHTIYRSIDRRSRLDVLYLLHAIKFENIWSDEI